MVIVVSLRDLIVALVYKLKNIIVNFIFDGSRIMTTLVEAVEKINSLEQGQDEIVAAIAGVTAAQATTDLKLDDVRALVAELKANNASPEEIDALNGKLDGLVTKQAAIKTALSELASQANAVRDEAQGIE